MNEVNNDGHSFFDQNEVDKEPINGTEKAEINYYLAGFWMRFWAYLVDLMVIGSVDRLLVKSLFRLLGISMDKTGMFSPLAIATAVVFYLYFVLMTKLTGQTIGKMIFGLKVISLKETKRTWGTILIRELIGRYISTTVWILYVIVAFTPKKQGLHDMFADTTVVREENKKQLLQPAL